MVISKFYEQVVSGMKVVDSFNTTKKDTIELCINLSNRADVAAYNRALSTQIQLENLVSPDVQFLCFSKQALSLGDNIKVVQGDLDLVNQIRSGALKVDQFDYCISTVDMMKSVMQIGSILGPVGLMPNKRLGTVSNEIESTINSILTGNTVLRCSKSRQIRVLFKYSQLKSHSMAKDMCSILDFVQTRQYLKVKFSPIKSVFLYSNRGVCHKVF